jgi:hypothetical protein
MIAHWHCATHNALLKLFQHFRLAHRFQCFENFDPEKQKFATIAVDPTVLNF